MSANPALILEEMAGTVVHRVRPCLRPAYTLRDEAESDY